MTCEQIQWALNHDWAVSTCVDLEGNLGVEVRNDAPASDDAIRFYDFKTLKARRAKELTR